MQLLFFVLLQPNQQDLLLQAGWLCGKKCFESGCHWKKREWRNWRE